MGFSGDLIDLNGDLMEIYPLVNVYITNWQITMLLMGKSTISTRPFSIANC